VAGKIERLFVDEGAIVKKGDVLAVLDKEELTKSRHRQVLTSQTPIIL
jgi:multidrug efflux pump subunit AcrA (membrane-fusion protein)